MSIPTAISFGAGGKAEAWIEDLSFRGFSARCRQPFRARDPIKVDLPRLGPVAARISWCKDGRIGGSFERPVDMSVFLGALEAARGRAGRNKPAPAGPPAPLTVGLGGVLLEIRLEPEGGDGSPPPSHPVAISIGSARLHIGVRVTDEALLPDAEPHASALEAEAVLGALTGRERDVLSGLVRGLPNKTIAYDLGISARTVEIYRSRLMTKLGARSLSELLRTAFAIGLTPEPGRAELHAG